MKRQPVHRNQSGRARWSRAGALVVLLAALSVVGCAGSTGGSEQPVQGATEVDPALVALVDQARDSFNEQTRARGMRAQFAEELQAAMERAADPQRLTHRVLVERYEARDWAPWLLDEGRWSARAAQLLAVIGQADDHALRDQYPNVAALQRDVEVLEAAAEAHRDLQSFEPTDADWSQVLARLEAEGFNARAADAREVLDERLLVHDERNPMPRWAGRLRNLRWSQAQWKERAVRLETQLSLAFVDYAAEMRLAYRKNLPRVERWAPVASDDTLLRARLGATLDLVDRAGVEAALASLVPPHPQYRHLVQARRRYAEIAAQGGWPEVTFSRDIRRGRSSEAIGLIKQRLALEGYDVGAVNDDYDRDLVRAVKLYQDTHQYTVDGEIDEAFVRNLNLSVEDRLAKIDTTLQRYRETVVGSFPYYILVNIPDFHAEVWRQGERLRRFRIVIGNNDRKRDPATGDWMVDEEGRVVHPNRTPLQTATLRYVIYNPYWNVPPRIKSEELDLKLEENPFYYEENRFEIVNPDAAPQNMRVRQLPGPNNTLGRVKFIFPNPHNVFLHDTSSRSVFRRPYRALSHGCMRVHEPLELAELLLRNDGQYDEDWIEELLNTEPYEETTIRLRQPIVVHADYFNTRVDDSGQVAFLSDIYGHDSRAIDARRAELEERYAPARQRRVEQAAALGAEGVAP